MEPFRLPADLASALCDRLGVPWPGDVADLAPLYRAWCREVPFDNVGKQLAVAEGRRPPGDDPAEVVATFLASGLGGTCWAHVSALAGLLTTAGARTTVGLDRMARTDGVIDFHSFVVVHDGDRRLVLDPVWVSGPPMPLEAGATGSHPVIGTAFERDGGHGRLWHRASPPGGSDLRYAVLSTVLDRDDVRAFCAVSVHHSGVPTGVLSVRRTPPDGTVALRGPDPGAPAVLTLRRRSATAAHDDTFADADAAFAAVGCPPEARRRAERAGLIPRALGAR